MKKNETNITTTDNFANSTDVSKNADISAETEEIGREYILTCGYYFAGKDMPVGEFDIFALSGYGFVLSIGPHDNLLCISEHLGANTAHHTTSFKRVSLLEGGVLSVDINLELKIVFSKIVSGFPGQQFNQVGAVRIPPGDYSDGVVLPDSLYGPLKDDISENSKAKYIAAVAADKAKAANADTATDKAKVANADTSTDKVKAANADTIADTVTDIPPGKLGSIGREYILTCGHYFAGIDIPTGKFDVFVLDGSGEIMSSDAAGACTLHALLGDDGEPGLHSCEGVLLSEGGVFTVEKYLELKIVYSEIASGYSGRRYNQEVAIDFSSGNYICGEDFPPGVYSVLKFGSYGLLSSTNKKYGLSGWDDFVTKFNNTIFNEGDILYVIMARIRLVPAFSD